MFGFGKSKFVKAIDAGLRRGDLSDIDKHLRDAELTDVNDADAIVRALDAIGDWQTEPRLKAVHELCHVMRQVATRAAFDVIRQRALPVLIERFAQVRHDPDAADDWNAMDPLKVMALYYFPEGVEVIAEAAAGGFAAGSYWWTTVFNSFDSDSPLRGALCDRLASTLPADFCGVAFLDFANATAIAADPKTEFTRHPFNNPAGVARIEAWLTDADPDHFSHAHSATAALPFIDSPDRDRLMALAMDHPDPSVQMEAAWASAKIGSQSGVKMLARFCTDARTSRTAVAYLEELGRPDAVPPQARDEDFAALATMTAWLAHPQEMGRHPDEIDLHDRRDLYWPPCGERRTLYLFRYVYEPRGEDDTRTVGVGLVGGLTPWSFFGSVDPNWPPADMLAYHCSWESLLDHSEAGLQAVDECSLEHGRAMLAEHNSGF